MVALGYLLIVIGVALILLGVLAWLGVIKPVQVRAAGGLLAFLAALLEKAPWVVVVGVFLIYVGCKMAGVALPF